MRFRNSRKTRKVDISCTVTAVRFEIQEDRLKGRAIIDYDRWDDRGQQVLQIVLRIWCLWMEQQKGNAIKVHMIHEPGIVTHRNFMADLEKLGTINCPDGFNLISDGRVIRYGKRDGNYSVHDSESYQTMVYYDSKAIALNAAMAEISRYQTIGGLNRVSFQRVPDQVLLEAGFEKIQDVMRTKANVPVGIPMWKGNINKLFSGQAYGTEAARSRKQFLELIGKAINQPL